MVTKRLGKPIATNRKPNRTTTKRQHALRHARPGWRHDRRENEERETERVQKDARLPEIGDFVGGFVDPARQVPRPIDRRRVDKQHRGDDRGDDRAGRNNDAGSSSAVAARAAGALELGSSARDWSESAEPTPTARQD